MERRATTVSWRTPPPPASLHLSSGTKWEESNSLLYGKVLAFSWHGGWVDICKASLCRWLETGSSGRDGMGWEWTATNLPCAKSDAHASLHDLLSGFCGLFSVTCYREVKQYLSPVSSHLVMWSFSFLSRWWGWHVCATINLTLLLLSC